MKQFVWMLLSALCISYSSSAQQDGLAIEGVTGLTSSATPVSGTQELPYFIQASITSILGFSLGTIADSLKFSHGQILHFKSVKNAGAQADSTWVVPMYDLRFQLRDTVLGIRSYELELRIDHKGRLLFLNWPNTGYSSREMLAPWQSVLDYATGYAKRRKFYTAGYQVQLRYNTDRGKMVWIFQWPVKDLSSRTMLRTIEIDWQGPDLIKEYIDNY